MLHVLAQAQRKMNFSDFQKGFQQWNDGKTDSSLSTGLLAMVIAIALVALVLHFRARMRAQKAPDSESKLFRELARTIRIPLLTRLSLKWVARSTQVPAAVLLVSEQAFTTCITRWESHPTFTPLRRWSKRRLEQLRPALFAEC